MQVCEASFSLRATPKMVAVITGAASGIGRGLAERFAAEGMKVVLADVDKEQLVKLEADLSAKGATVLAVRTDVSKASEVEDLAAQTLDHVWGSPYPLQ